MVMKAVHKIPPPPWMVAPESVAVMDILNEESANALPQALFVGGCVRNTLMNRIVDDIDIATPLLPQEVMTRFEKRGFKVIPTGIDHGTVTAIINKKTFEITTLRRDLKTDGRHATVIFTDGWKEDAARRDFTMNTLLANRDGHIFDPTGRGLEDLKAGHVMFVGDPAQRIAEDYLRILRFFRFHAFYGTGTPDPQALEACKSAAQYIGSLSRERVTQEFFKIMRADNAADVLKIMFKNNILNKLSNVNYKPLILARLVEAQKKYGMYDLVARLVVLTRDCERLEQYLIFSNKQKKDFRLIIKALDSMSGLSDKDIKRLVYHYGAETIKQTLLYYSALHNVTVDIGLVQNWQPPVFPVKGDDIMAAGIPAGPMIGAALARLEQWWIENDMKPDKAACLRQL
ncbi:MAG: CCA tRNA nucleotidyltransferase [Alphaproteobacteria bacterium CG_4_9_14_3_um_filter_47_13]|nr:MAG: CCA tRNA nucleotidyltransferase [Alphaproteobacteria bacterium CG_4_9_14_3_um_filter_47_13]